jgi:hypothetical protein
MERQEGQSLLQVAEVQVRPGEFELRSSVGRLRFLAWSDRRSLPEGTSRTVSFSHLPVGGHSVVENFIVINKVLNDGVAGVLASRSGTTESRRHTLPKLRFIRSPERRRCGRTGFGNRLLDSDSDDLRANGPIA